MTVRLLRPVKTLTERAADSVELGASWHPNAMSVEEFSIDEFSSEDEFMDVSDFEEDDEDDDVGAFGAFEEEQRLARQKSFTCLTSKSLEVEAVAKASHIQEVLSLPLAVVERLLFLYRLVTRNITAAGLLRFT